MYNISIKTEVKIKSCSKLQRMTGMLNLIRIVLLIIVSSYPLFARSFYVRPDGNNDNDGLSDANAWASVGKVREYAWAPGFGPGDSILFKGGETHSTNQALYVQGDKCGGTQENPLVIGSYGSGRARIEANGDDFLNIWIPDAASASGSIQFALVVENLNIVGNEKAKAGPANSSGITIKNSSESDIDLLHITHCDISGFAGDGIWMERNDKSKGRFNNLKIRYVNSFNNPGASGVGPHSGSAEGGKKARTNGPAGR